MQIVTSPEEEASVVNDEVDERLASSIELLSSVEKASSFSRIKE